MMIVGIIFGLGFWLAIALMIGFVLYFFFRLLLQPLAIPKSAGIEYKRERLMCYLLFATLLVSWIGFIVLGITYLIGFLRHLRRNSASAGTDQPETSRIIPRFVLSELLLMVFGLGVLPLVVQGLAQHQDKRLASAALYGGFAIFPACYLCALYRLNFHRIPSGPRRSLFIVLTPYCALSVPSIALGSLILLFSGSINVQPSFYIWVAAATAVAIVTRITASQIAEAAMIQKIQASPQSPTSPPG